MFKVTIFKLIRQWFY